WVGRTSPATLAKLNQELGTSIDFDALSGFEGGQWRKTYIPCSGNMVAGASGVTVATGFDVGQVSPASIDAMDLPPATRDKLKKFAGKSYKGQTCANANAAMNKLGVETFDPAEADAIDYAVKKKHLAPAQASWNATVPVGKPKFAELTPAQQTVIFSRTYHQGTGMPQTPIAQGFYKAAQEGDWLTAEQKLRNYAVTPDWYKNRVAAEADLLAKERKASMR
ncbi:MAG TPA: pesticin C-terminus-like muramidase, partial [Longimicrobium sp.]|nr:pesticin C-terminus-like muramidase [Longimicrobium sp.]